MTNTQTNNEYDYKLEILMMGDYDTGKGSVMNRYINDSFQSYEKTRGAEYKFKDILYNGQRLNIQICDINGGEKFRLITSSYYRRSHGFMLLYDVTNQSSFDNLQIWLKEIKKYCPLIKSSIVIIGNKSDLPNHVIDISTSKQFCDSLSIQSIQLVSAKSSLNINESFQLLIDQMINNLDEIIKTNNIPSSPSSSSNSNSDSCNIL